MHSMRNLWTCSFLELLSDKVMHPPTPPPPTPPPLLRRSSTLTAAPTKPLEVLYLAVQILGRLPCSAAQHSPARHSAPKQISLLNIGTQLSHSLAT